MIKHKVDNIIDNGYYFKLDFYCHSI